MAIGSSGRLIIELDPEVKKKLHAAVKRSGMTMKEWFEEKAQKDFPEAFKDTKKDLTQYVMAIKYLSIEQALLPIQVFQLASFSLLAKHS